jgi:amidase
MSVRRPTISELDAIAASYNLTFTSEELALMGALADATMASYDRLDQLTEPSLPVHYPRTPGYRPAPEENPLNAWYWRSEIRGADSGSLAGKTLAIKDNVCVAGVPMMNGTAVLEGYVPEVDATVVTRILEAGGTILGKAVCESLCFSGGSHTSDTGPVRNPHDVTRSAGGSSSGSAALVAAGEVDMALGGDQGGSIRIPSCWCGVYGLKPTWGLVPYTGVFPIELTLDHTGPIARTVSDVALLLEVIAGPDGLDPRQHRSLQAQAYTQALNGDLRGLRVGIVEEGFGWPNLSAEDVDEAVREAAQAFTRLSAEVESASIPLHRDGIHIWNAIAIEGATMLMVAGNSMGTNWKGHYTSSLLEVYGRGRIEQANLLSGTTKLVVLLGQYMQDQFLGRYYARGQNLGRALSDQYDASLKTYDVLVMPTLPLKATLIPTAGPSQPDYYARALEMIPNTAPFDVTGHPAMNVPCALSEGLPVGMMLVGRKGDESTILRAAHAFEQQVFAAPSPREAVAAAV